MNQFGRRLDLLSQAAAGLSKVLIGLYLAVIILSILLQIFFRFVMGSALSWSEELSVLVFAHLVFVGGSLGVREGYHVSVSLFVDSLPQALRRGIDVLVLLAVLVFGAVLLWGGYDYVSMTMNRTSPAIGYPSWLLGIVAPVAGALIVIHAAALLANPSLRAGDEKPSAEGTGNA